MVDALPYGSWPSPLTADWASGASPRFEGAAFVGDEVWWGESVPSEGGRTTVRRGTADGLIEDLLPAPGNARSRVHEYGGGAWTASADGRLFFVEKEDQRIWIRMPGVAPQPLTSSDADTRFGGLRWQAGMLLAVRERHGTQPVPQRDIVAVAEDGTVVSLAAGSDFVAQPALSPDGRHLAWVAWDHPDMPWDRTQLRVGRMQGGAVTDVFTVAGGQTAALQPEWVGDDTLVYIDDPSDRWNLWRARLDTASGSVSAREPVAPADADTGGGLWVLGLRWFSPLEEGGFIAVRTHGSDELIAIGPDGRATALDVPPTARLVIEDCDGARVLVSGAAVGGTGLWLVAPGAPAVRIAGGPGDMAADWYPRGRPVTFEGPHGPVHAFDYPPTNPEVTAPDGELPPYVVFVHGGPTSHVGGVAESKVAFLTSRGIGVLDVNYGGSTGYGRAYRDRLKGQWGVVDVDDVIAAATALSDAGAADPARLAIAGGSAGGWTVLCSLTRSDVFTAGISRYGVADLRRLVADTHDFEARYLDGLVGELPAAEAVYVERSPLSRLDRLRTPLLIEQGLEDEVVPPSQSEAVRDALATNGVAHAYLAFEGEGHGFRRAETIVRTLEAELAFLGQVWGFATPGVAPVDLDG
ncbi:prolyl oligopeptidase family serine peptidase [Microbacterium invictum]|uniref:Dipeptidyl aminopeptidase/acylaminoacyl peptidase n=1 Tax=Microbacterium invictum TaxID=515415 RepID=A0AA40VM74_9MICO|nr:MULTISPECIES: prolyl oligopeptidase family serine peptidase [Microbacterium]MBB4139517.1 dipeptidyl aminopeptidase/acylaminoacyl peptidase [Microbacterium invictum]